MYDEHFGLTTRPFQLTPDPRFWFSTATHRKAMAYLGYGLAQGEGFIVITGEIGAGKTTLAGHLIETIDPQRINVVRLVSTAIGADDLLRTVATALGVDPHGLPKALLLGAIERGLHTVARTGRRTLLMVDEVQALPVDSLEELRMLSNFQAGGQAMLQILLLGQPEFRDRLHGSDALEQLRQRVIAIHHLDPMGEDEVADYLAHRLSVAGWRGRPDFAADAFAAFHRGSGGVPRRLNALAGRTMLAAAVEGRELIDAALVEGVIRDLEADLPLPSAVEPEPVVQPAPKPVAAGDPEPALAKRIAQLEARIEQQDAALRRVLTLLVDWVESDQPRPGVASIRGPAAWEAAA
jgi:putative secretion ATPase (PEP-CTERM system associated)